MPSFSNTIDTIQIIANTSPSRFQIKQDGNNAILIAYDQRAHMLRELFADAIARMTGAPAQTTYTVKHQFIGAQALGLDVTAAADTAVLSFDLRTGPNTSFNVVASFTADEAANIVTLADEAFAALG